MLCNLKRSLADLKRFGLPTLRRPSKTEPPKTEPLKTEQPKSGGDGPTAERKFRDRKGVSAKRLPGQDK
jgi:hypothetical protein